ncbi:single-stranded DNA-binding protein [Parasaccharibacter sp. TMW2.1882]|uniref:Single-stranded DNA-binding protein n=2 Tax=Acetobacteraceae TaxID=433 RepID=A0A7U7G539_9PROT|nr:MULTISPECIES: single-stranded DNA-binding protein [Acetobacteraceae]MCL1563300.1 single-stranded DNA-binding protein [Parasaccharibacter sp. TMW 2.1886]MCQ0041903.1 single-stranded DNA-binding protein [Bombella sp.]MUG80140.1 single-stranded DNA-binding protein [Bombella sp. ESL0380]MUH03491.1 single-stranded DNA-binding protein [Bombella sp. ESL0387]QGT75707.1 single-stranded DNA-binding protein [Bombella sp. ESL0368]
MAGSVNKVILVGNLGRDPEVRNTQSGSKIVNLAIATSDTWNDRNTGERRDRTEWHRVVIFNERVGDVAERYLRKGRKVYIEGELRTRKWTDQQGVEKYTTEVVIDRFRGNLVLLDSQRGGGDGGGYGDDGYDGGYGDGGSNWAGGGSAPAGRGGAGGRGQQGGNFGGGAGWDSSSGQGDQALDDEIPF